MLFEKLIFFIITMIIMASLISAEIIRSSRKVHEPIDTKPKINAVLLTCSDVESDKSDNNANQHSCQDQLIVNIKLNPSFNTEKCEKYLVLDEAYDPRKRTKAKILSPYLIELSRGEAVMMYPLKFDKSLNCDSCGNPGTNSRLSAEQQNENTDSITLSDTNKKGRKAPYKPIDAKKLTEQFEKEFRERNGLRNPNQETHQGNTKLKTEDNSINGMQKKAQLKLHDRDSNPSNTQSKLESKINHDEELFKRHLTKYKKLKKFKGKTIPDFVYQNIQYKNDEKEKENNLQNVGNTEDTSNDNGKDSKSDQLKQQEDELNHEGTPKESTAKEENIPVGDSNLLETTHNLESKSEKAANLIDNNSKNDQPNLKRNACEQKCKPVKEKKPADKYVYQNIQYKNEQKDDLLKSKDASPQPVRFNKRRANTDAPFSHFKYETDENGKLTTSLKTCNFLRPHKESNNPSEKIQSENHPEANLHNRKRRSIFDVDKTKDEGYKTPDESVEPKYGRFNAKKFLKSHEMLNLLQEASEIEPQYPNKNNYIADNKFKDEDELKFTPTDNNNNNNNTNNIINNNNNNNNNDNNNENIYNKYIDNNNENIYNKYNDNNYNNDIDNYAWNQQVQQNELPYKQKFRLKDNWDPKSLETGKPQYSNIPLENDDDDDDDDNKFANISLETLLQGFKFNNEVLNFSSNNENEYLFPLKPKEHLNPTKELGSFDEASLLAENAEEYYKFHDFPSLRKNNNIDMYKTKEKDKAKERLFTEHYDKDGFHHFPPLRKDPNEDDNLLNKLKPMSWFDTTYKLKSVAKTEEKAPLEDRRHQTIIGKYFGRPSSSKISGKLYNTIKYKPDKDNRFDSIITDPGLDFKDKMTAIDHLDPNMDILNKKYKSFSKDFSDNKATPTPLLMSGDRSSLFSKRSPKLKSKRSFLMYADLESKDTLDDFDYVFGDFDSSFNDQNTVNDDIQSCATCGGKKKKPPPPTEDKDEDCKVRLHKSKPQIPRRDINENEDYDIEPLCTSCGGKNKKPDAGRPCFEDDMDCQCRNLKSPCYCKTRKRESNSVENNWYSVYKMNAPLPYLTTKIRIFRKCQGMWWKIAPSIIMNSLSATYANDNLSVLFSSHVDIFQLEKSHRLKNHNLLIPNKKNYRNYRLTNKPKNIKHNLQGHIDLRELNTYPELILHVGSLNKRKTDKVASTELLKNDGVLCQAIKTIQMKKRENQYDGFNKPISLIKYLDAYLDSIHKDVEDVVQSITQLGLQPNYLKLITRCPHDRHRLCINTREDKAPEMNIKIRMPFSENSLMSQQAPSVKITKIIADATTKDVLVVCVDVINDNSNAQLFEISVPDCVAEVARNNSDIKYSKNKYLAPLIGETIYFMLPRTDDKKKYECSVNVKTTTSRRRELQESKSYKRGAKTAMKLRQRPKSQHIEQLIAFRNLNVVPDSTCFCVWKCKCHCIKRKDSIFDSGNACKQMDIDSLANAGLLQGEDLHPQSNSSSFMGLIDAFAILRQLTLCAICVLLLSFLLGFLKAVIGLLCCCRIDECGFNKVKLGRSYECSSKKRRFFINTFFFILWPFLCWCKCCEATEQDLLVSKSSWRCFGGEDKAEYMSLSFPGQYQSEDEEDVILEQKVDSRGKKYVERHSGGGSTKHFASGNSESLNMPFLDDLLDDEADNEESNTRYVLQALSDSREAMKKVLCAHTSETTIEVGEDHEKFAEADALVQSLKNAQIVYRIFSQPVGDLINIPKGMHYCMRGYFLPSVGTSFEFINYSPLAQYICLTSDKTCLAKLHPPAYLNPADFARIYKNKIDVLEAQDLVCKAPLNIPCLNITPSQILPEAVANLMRINLLPNCRQPLPRNIVRVEDAALERQHLQSPTEFDNEAENNNNDEDQCA